ncbi:MAG TPA: FAD:protein FMN transferase [Candidatus Polarisedimenticolaceae bacterium]|nr:FAD:protein FMN transferase [Candidatus Polarisedimenticolaceae bacterium]
MRRGVVGIGLAAIVSSCAGPGLTRSWPVMGTFARATVTDPDPAAAERAVARVRETFGTVDAAMSNWTEESELSRLNREAGRGTYRIADANLAACVAAALDGAARTGGLFDPTVGPLMTLWGFRPKTPRVPGDAAIAEAMARVGAARVRFDRAAASVRFEREGMEIDLGGIAKGCALDAARRAIVAPRRFGLLDLGGGLAFFGEPPGHVVDVDLRDPRDPEASCGEARLPPGITASTSSDLENRNVIGGVVYGHIMDPRTGRPAVTAVVQATAFHTEATISEILSKALFIGGLDGAPAVLRAYPDAEAVLIVAEGDLLAVVASRSLQGRLTLTRPLGFTPDSPRFTLPAATMTGRRVP